MGFCKGFVRYAVITGLVGGTALLIAGPERIHALFTQAKGSINSVIDQAIEDPVALRAQLTSLEGEYPRRIESVQGDLCEVRAQQEQLKREMEVSKRVVELARADSDQLQELIGGADSARASATLAAEGGSPRVVKVVFAKQSIGIEDAYQKANQVRQVHNAYVVRAEDIERDLGYLAQQEQRLAALLGQLEAEHADFRAQVWQLDRQVDTIARNDRLIGMMERREKTIREQSRYSAGSLEHVQARFADLKARQESRLKTLGTAVETSGYEDRAKYELGGGSKSRGLPELRQFQPKANVIEIRPEDAQSPDTLARGSST